jgi:hypothetical protein
MKKLSYIKFLPALVFLLGTHITHASGWFSAPDTFSVAMTNLGKSLEEASKNLDPAKVQEIIANIQQTLKESTATVANSLGKAFHDTHHTVQHSFDPHNLLQVISGVSVVGCFALSGALIYKSLTATKQTLTRSYVQIVAGIVFAGLACAELALLTDEIASQAVQMVPVVTAS